MSPLRRQRAVYRVYDEDEFLGGTESGEIFEPTASGIGERRLRRLAGAAMLAGAAGAVGAVIAASSMPSGRGAVRKMRASLHPSVRPRVARTAVGAPISSSHESVQASRGRRRGERKPGSQRLAGVASSPDVAPARDETSRLVARSVAPAAVASGQREHIEFGFER